MSPARLGVPRNMPNCNPARSSRRRRSSRSARRACRRSRTCRCRYQQGSSRATWRGAGRKPDRDPPSHAAERLASFGIGRHTRRRRPPQARRFPRHRGLPSSPPVPRPRRCITNMPAGLPHRLPRQRQRQRHGRCSSIRTDAPHRSCAAARTIISKSRLSCAANRADLNRSCQGPAHCCGPFLTLRGFDLRALVRYSCNKA